MKVVLLIGLNFARRQWLFITIMLTYVAGMAGVIALHEQRPELMFYFQLQASYVLGFGVLLAAPAIQTDSKSRRVLAVLSKGIHRWQYLGGLLCGCVMITALLCAAVAVIVYALATQISIPTNGLLQVVLALFLASAAAISVALFCSVVLHPLLATAAASVILLLPFLLEPKGIYLPSAMFPVYAIVHVVKDYRFQAPGSGLWQVASAAAVETVVFWMAASVLFARKDVTVASE
jgi:ABC-type transport system involved in multi-copper enzyme maturation permease subunit